MPAPQTVLSISQNHFVRGGSDRMFFDTNALLGERGHRVITFTAANKRNLPSPWSGYFPEAADFDHPGPRDLLRYIYSPGAAHALRRLLAAERPDLAHLHIYYGKLTAAILAPLRRAGVPVVQTLHEYKLICPVYTLVSHDQVCEACQGRHFLRALPRRCNRDSLARTALSVTEAVVSRALGAASLDHYIAISHFQRGKLIEHGLDPERITTVYNFVPSTAVPVPPEGAGEHFIYFGRMERLKGVFTLIDAFAPLRHLTLLMVGTGSADAEVARRIEAGGLKHIKLLGFMPRPELERYLAAARAAVLPAEWLEPFGLTPLESFALGRPVVCTRIGAFPETVREDEDGFLVPPGDVEALRARILWLAQNPAAARRMGMAGQRKVAAEFTPDRYYAGLMQVYQKVLR